MKSSFRLCRRRNQRANEAQKVFNSIISHAPLLAVRFTRRASALGGCDVRVV